MTHTILALAEPAIDPETTTLEEALMLWELNKLLTAHKGAAEVILAGLEAAV